MLGKILNITSLQNPIIKDLTKIIRSNNQKEIKSFICEGNFFLKSAFLLSVIFGFMYFVNYLDLSPETKDVIKKIKNDVIVKIK